MNVLPFWKVESVGNDFPLLYTEDVKNLALARQVSVDFQLAELAVRMSDRRFGVGGDGILTLERKGDGVVLRMFNPDGTEDFCGNGIRCAAFHARLHGIPLARLEHGGRDIPIRVEGDVIATTIGQADYTPEKVPVVSSGEAFNVCVWSGEDAGMPLSFFGSALTTGSTHVVIPTVAIPDDESFRAVSAKIEVDVRYPQRTSVIWCREAGPMSLEIRIWERGVGETQGCGTGSSAAAADYLRRKRTGGRVEVRNPGGTLHVEAGRWDAPLTIYGTADEPYAGEFLL